MAEGLLLSRVLLELPIDNENAVGRQLSGMAFDPEGRLWLAGDESGGVNAAVSCLQPAGAARFAGHRAFAVGDFVDLLHSKDEADFEGIDCDGGYLWFVGSHSRKRKQPRGKNAGKDVKRLTEMVSEANRMLLGRLPIADGVPAKAVAGAGDTLTAARLDGDDDGTELTEALRKDIHLGPMLKAPLGSKENGFDIEGLAVRGNRVIIGLRGPVLAGYAILLELKLADADGKPGRLHLRRLAPGGPRYRKHFIDLDGLGVRDLAFDADGQLLVLAGPTMAIEGAIALYRLRLADDDDTDDTLTDQEPDHLEYLFALPRTPGVDKPEAMALYRWNDRPAVLIGYDTPSPARVQEGFGVYADVLALR